MNKERAELAAMFLHGMIASPPVVERDKVDKQKWVRNAFEWANAFLEMKSAIEHGEQQ